MAKLYFYFSSMNAGKSTTLLQANYNYQERGMRTALFTPVIDNRAGEGIIASRIGIKANAQTFTSKDNLHQLVTILNNKHKLDCILIDEGHFLNKKQVYQLCGITDELNIPVLVYGLRTDFKAEPFEGSIYLLALADHLVELKAVCKCGSKAIMNVRVDTNGNKVKDGSQIAIGGNEMYNATCRKHFELEY